MNSGQKEIYNVMRILKYRLDGKKFQELLENTFEESKKGYEHVSFRNGITESMFIEEKKEESSH